ncbi:hypothetical protein FB446DRAFT_799474, partial [Lentinula raphanica]
MGMRIFQDEAMGMDSDDAIEEEEEVVVKKSNKKKTKTKKIPFLDSDDEDDAGDSGFDDNSDEEDDKKKKKTVKQEVHTKVVEKAKVDSIDELARQLRSLNVHDVNYAGVYAQIASVSPLMASAIASLPKEIPSVTMSATPAMPMAPYPNPSYQTPPYQQPSYPPTSFQSPSYQNPTFPPPMNASMSQNYSQFPSQQYPGPMNSVNMYQNAQGPPATYPNSIPVQGNGYGGPPRNGQRGRGLPNGPLPPHVLCFFCKENHLLRNCTQLPGYIQSNRVVQMGRWFYWPDGHPQARQVIQADPNTGVKRVIDRPAAPPQQPAVETVEADTSASEESGGAKVEGIVDDEVDDERMGDVRGVEEVVEEVFGCGEIVGEVEEKEDEFVWFEGFELERIEEAETMVTTRAAGKKKKDEVEGVRMDDEAKVGGTSQTKKKENKKELKDAPNDLPAFTYESKAEIPEKETEMFERMLNVQVPE